MLEFTINTDADTFINWFQHATKRIHKVDFKTEEGRSIDVQPVKIDRRDIFGGIAYCIFSAVLEIEATEEVSAESEAKTLNIEEAAAEILAKGYTNLGTAAAGEAKVGRYYENVFSIDVLPASRPNTI